MPAKSSLPAGTSNPSQLRPAWRSKDETRWKKVMRLIPSTQAAPRRPSTCAFPVVCDPMMRRLHVRRSQNHGPARRGSDEKVLPVLPQKYPQSTTYSLLTFLGSCCCQVVLRILLRPLAVRSMARERIKNAGTSTIIGSPFFRSRIRTRSLLPLRYWILGTVRIE